MERGPELEGSVLEGVVECGGITLVRRERLMTIGVWILGFTLWDLVCSTLVISKNSIEK